MKIMKNFKLSFILLAAIVSFTPVVETKAQSVSVSVNFNTFQQELSPYGRWMNNPRYGQVWIYNDASFKPYYSDGHWEYTNYGWSWISDYDWGWAPFHYGRWENDPYYGWMWIPGYDWAPAWVSWSSCDDYYGWAPLGFGVNLNISFGSIPQDRWNFIPRRNICERNINRYCIPYQRNNNFRNVVVINNYYNGRDGIGRYQRGPERREAERFTNNRIEERRVDYNDRNWSRGNIKRNNNDNNTNGNGRRRNDVNSNNNPSSQADQSNRRTENNNNRPDWRRNNNGSQQSNGTGNDNNPRRRDMNTNRDNNTTPPVIENRRPSRDANSAPQTNENNNPGSRQNENRMNRSNDQQNNAPQQQQRYERPAPQQQRPQREQPAPQQQQQQRYERQAPQQQSAPAPEQRRMYRRGENTGGTNMQPANGNSQRGNRSGERRSNG
jgi:hypothetical protein